MRQYWRRYAVGLAALIFVDGLNVCLPLTVKVAIDALAPKLWHRVLWAAGLYLLMMLGQSIGRYIWRIYLIGTSHFIAAKLRRALYAHLQTLPLGYYQRVRTGDLMSRATNDIESIRMAVGPGVLVTVDAALVFLMIVPVMLALSVKLSLLAFAFYPLVPWLTARVGDRIDKMFEALQIKMSHMGAFAQESFAGIRLIKSLVLEKKVHERFHLISEDYRREGKALAKYEAGFTPALSALTNLGTFLILLLGGRDVMRGVISVGTFVAFQRFVVQLSWPMEAIGWAVTMNREGFAADRRLKEVLEIPPVVSHYGNEGTRDSSAPLLSIRSLEYTHTSHAHSNFSLSLSDLKIDSGQKVGIVGPVGSGKSTLFSLILRLYEPPDGAIFLEGRDVRGIPLPELRASIASVEQQVFLFSEKIATNISLGLSDMLAKEELWKLLGAACIEDEVQSLPDSGETPLGERGVNLSGGQKQRLALVRALARKPGLLLLDDAFSAVDVDVEDRIIANLFSAYPTLSVLFASHRLSIMPRMDEVWVFDQGRCVAKGPHSELLQKSRLYRELWNRSARETQMSRFEIVETLGDGATGAIE